MTWDPEIDDPIQRPRPRIDPDGDGAAGAGPEPVDLGLRAAPADPFAPIDPNAPVSGHRPPAPTLSAVTDPAESDWSTASTAVMAVLRAPGTDGLAVEGLDLGNLSGEGVRDHRRPLVARGPADLVVAFVLPAAGFDVLVTAEHLLAWGIEAGALVEAAGANLARWSGEAPWSVEEDEQGRRIVSSASGDGWDAGRILLPDARARLRSELPGGRIVVGVPDRDLLVAARLASDDPQFGELFASFVADQADAADERIDARVFELVDDDLVPFPG